MDPEILPYFNCFVLCDRQLRVAFGGAYALDWGVVMSVARAHHIECDGWFFRLLRCFETALFIQLKPKPKVTDDA